MSKIRTFQIETLEYFETRAHYTVDAKSEFEATQMIVQGFVAYDHHEHPGDGDIFEKVLSCKEVEEEAG